MFSKIKACPLCKSIKHDFFSKLKKNLYSEILSKIVKIEEQKLLNKIENKICKNCGLVFKNYWFNDKVLEKIYNIHIPVHPRGRDFKSSLFSKPGFKKEYQNLLKAKKNNNIELLQKHSRTIKSIIFSIPKYEKLKSTKWIVKKFTRSFDSNLNIELLEKNFNGILKLIDKPEDFKRFSGYESYSVWNNLLSKVKVKTYGEIGCPRWGLLEIAKKEKKKIVFIEKNEKNFWGAKCIFGKKTCILIKEEKINFKKIRFEDKYSEKIDLVGIFQYLDHVRNPLQFFNKMAKISKHQAFIVDRFKDFDNTVYIQHFTGWSKKSFSWVANKLQKKLIYDFGKFKKTENELFLII